VKNRYNGFEIGPIRPPSEAGSLMLRVTRNCPWNQCKFCGLYKGKKFSKRPVEHVIQNIDTLKKHIDLLRNNVTSSDSLDGDLTTLINTIPEEERTAFQIAFNWFKGGMESVFLQDANTLIIKPDDLVKILEHLRQQFPEIRRITSYARSHTIARISDNDMIRLAAAGLNRIHIGMESAADEVLLFVKKGVDKKTQIKAGQRVKKAGIELSEYFMPGLGGVEHSRANALETADAMNQINPDFIRIRTLAVTDFSDLASDVQAGRFTPLNDVDTARELLLFLESMKGITSVVKSDHILNLFQDVDGTLPNDQKTIKAPIKQFLKMAPEKQMVYRIGRRTGIFSSTKDLENPTLLSHALKAKERYGVNLDNLDEFTTAMIRQFI
jgi:hypothetical protein